VVRAVVGHPDDEEQQGRRGAVREHLHRGAVEALAREARGAEQHVAHVADRRVGHEALEVVCAMATKAP
jgi:hypothetical protein